AWVRPWAAFRLRKRQPPTTLVLEHRGGPIPVVVGSQSVDPDDLPGPAPGVIRSGPENKRGGPMALALNIGKCTLLGNYRENNEDAMDVKQFPDLTLCLVADGMGGQAAGEIASKKAIDVVPRELKKHLQPSITQEDQVKTVIRKAIVQANEEIMTMGSLD